jgi:hypothetical protein
MDKENKFGLECKYWTLQKNKEENFTKLLSSREQIVKFV